MSAPPTPPRPAPEGPARTSLCPACRHVQRVASARGSVFWLCTRARTDPLYAKYPPQPVLSCRGFER